VTNEAVDLVVSGEERELRERPDEAPPRSPRYSPLLVLALDGVDRDLLYDMLKRGELPELAKLLGGDHDEFAHAHFDQTLISTLPSSTATAWVTAFTGVPPAEHGVTGNEFFVRQSRKLAAPVPTSFSDPDPVFQTYTDGYVNQLFSVPTVYERMRERDPSLLVWVAMHQVQRGADKLLVTGRSVLADAFKAFLQTQLKERLTQHESKKVYETLDSEVIDTVTDQIDDDDEPLADVITVYLSGTDQYAHVAESGPNRARRDYLRSVIDPLMGKLRKSLLERGGLKNRYVVVTSDHGHTEVVDDAEHSLSTDNDEDPPGVLTRAGFRLRPFSLNVSDDDDFNAVLAYQGALAFVYLADRTTCPKRGQRCDFMRPPRFEQDVLVAAEAFHRANQEGKYVRQLKGAFDMVLARRPRPPAERDLEFQVYVGDGRLVPVPEYLKAHPHPSYVALDDRLRELAVGPAGERAGDVLIIATNGNRERPEERYYFSFRYHSWHGSPSRQDSEVPLIVAHPALSTARIAQKTRAALGAEPRLQKLSDLLVALRFGE
jgi:Type I phosphodiesterase / nucleotide pyrophosphatase